MLENLPSWLKLKNRDFLLSKLLEHWQEAYSEVTPTPADKYLSSSFILDVFAQNKHSVHLLVDSKALKILYASENIKNISGYSREEFLERNMLLCFEMFHWDHLPFFFYLIRWLRYLKKKGPIEAAHESIRFQYVGLKLRTKTGETMRLLFNTYPLETMKETGSSGLVLITLENLAPLMKGDGYWARVEAGKTTVHHSCFFRDNSKLNAHDVLSNREKEILRLVASGMESKEISKLLFISTSTVENHRKNMIARLGARDSIALVEICRMCNII